MKLVGNVVQLTEDKSEPHIARPNMSSPWAGDFCNLAAAVRSLARAVESLRDEVKALKEKP